MDPSLMSICAEWDYSVAASVYWVAGSYSYVVSALLLGGGLAQDTKRGRKGVQWVVFVYTLYLLLWSGLLWIFQLVIDTGDRLDPFCPLRTTIGFPSVGTFYAVSFFATIVGFAYFCDLEVGLLLWLKLIVLTLIVPSVLTIFGPSTWREVALSIGLGLLSAIFFVVFVFYYIRPILPSVLNIFPFRQCIDTVLMSEEQHEEDDAIRAWKNSF